MNHASSPRRRPRPYQKTGIYKLKRAVCTLGSRALPTKRTALGRALRAWKADLVRDLGGDPSTQQAAIIDLAVRTKLLLDSIDAWLLVQPSLVNARKRALLPVVRERQSLADALARYLGQLGLERKARDVPDLMAYIASKGAPDSDARPESDTRTVSDAPATDSDTRIIPKTSTTTTVSDTRTVSDVAGDEGGAR